MKRMKSRLRSSKVIVFKLRQVIDEAGPFPNPLTTFTDFHRPCLDHSEAHQRLSRPLPPWVLLCRGAASNAATLKWFTAAIQEFLTIHGWEHEIAWVCPWLRPSDVYYCLLRVTMCFHFISLVTLRCQATTYVNRYKFRCPEGWNPRPGVAGHIMEQGKNRWDCNMMWITSTVNMLWVILFNIVQVSFLFVV